MDSDAEVSFTGKEYSSPQIIISFALVCVPVGCDSDSKPQSLLSFTYLRGPPKKTGLIDKVKNAATSCSLSRDLDF